MAPTRSERKEALRAALANAEPSRLVILACGAALVAAVLHLIVAPAHFAEHVGQGLFMVIVGALQILWALAFYRRVTLSSYVVGFAIALGAILVWVIAITVRPPFQDAAEPADAIAYTTEVAQAITVLALLILPFSRRGVGVGRAAPLVVAALFLGLVVGGGAYGAGLAGESLMPSLAEGAHMHDHEADGGGGGVGLASDHAGHETPPAANTSTNNTTASQDLGYDPSSCMVGMDMPGCTAAQADANYKKQQAAEAAKGPKPDQALPSLKIGLDPQSVGQTGGFSVDTGAKSLLVKIKLVSTGTGPYAALGPGGQGDLSVEFKAPGATSATKTITLTGTGAGSSVGADPANPMDKAAASDTILVTLEGGWTLHVLGQGTNVNVQVDMTERYTG
jgi:hypothetical protein